jgi:large subunit ribosomal protein L24
MKAHVKKDEVVVVISGAHRGKSGKVIAVDLKNQRVLVEGVNVGRKTLRKSQARPQGGIMDRERPVHLSNVMLESVHQERQTRRGQSTTGGATATQSKPE